VTPSPPPLPPSLPPSGPPSLPQPVTATDHTFVSWSTDFSNDASADAVLDSRFKKRTAPCLPFGHLPLFFSRPWIVSFVYWVTSLLVSSSFSLIFPVHFPSSRLFPLTSASASNRFQALFLLPPSFPPSLPSSSVRLAGEGLQGLHDLFARK
jgi:hypothetical protein